MPTRVTPVLLDVVLALLLTGLTVATLVEATSGHVEVLALVLAVLAVAPVALRQVAPVMSMLVIVGALAGYALLGYGDWPSSAVGLLVAMFSVATLRPRDVAALTYLAAVGVVLLALGTVEEVSWAMVVQALLVVLCAWGLGDATRRWAERARESATLAERSVARERTRIARELHDVVAHHMTVVAVQSGLAQYVLDSDPGTARSAIAQAGAASREAMNDMGRLLDALRADEGEPASYEPQPGLREVDALVQRLRDTGTDITLRRTGEVRDLTPGVELCCYRVVQESLTNVLKHGGAGCRTTVDLDFGERVLTAEVSDDGRGADRAAPVGGRGIQGMRERAELYGGVLDAGPRPGGGFTVRLRVPVDTDADERVRT